MDIFITIRGVILRKIKRPNFESLNLLKPTGYVMHQQFNIQQL